jgi:hypothetical protein
LWISWHTLHERPDLPPLREARELARHFVDGIELRPSGRIGGKANEPAAYEITMNLKAMPAQFVKGMGAGACLAAVWEMLWAHPCGGGGGVFVSYALKNQPLCDRLKLWLSERYNITPEVIVLEKEIGSTVFDILKKSVGNCCCGFVIYTADNELFEEKQSRGLFPRPNVLYELGLLQGVFGPQRVILLCRKDAQIPTNLEGLAGIMFDDRGLAAAYPKVEEALKTLGIYPHQQSGV